MRYSPPGKYFFTLFLITLVILTKATAQTADTLPVLDISNIKFSSRITDSVAMVLTDKNPSSAELTTLKYKHPFKDKITGRQVTKKVILYFKLTNPSANTAAVYFYPGRFFDEIDIYKSVSGSSPVLVPEIFPAARNNLSFREISLEANESAVFYVVLHQVKTFNSRVKPYLISDIYVNSFIVNEESDRVGFRLFTYVLCGLLLMMIFFSLINYSLGGNTEFLYYAFYVFFLGMLSFLKGYFGLQSNQFNFIYEGPLDFILFSAGHLFYFLFIQRFLDAEHSHRFVNSICKVGIYGLIISTVLYSVFHFFTDSFLPEYYLENVLKILLLALGLFFIFYAAKKREDKILGYLGRGNALLFIFSLFSLLFIFIGQEKIKLPGILNYSGFYYQLGILLELVFFLAGLSYKNKNQIIEQTRERERLKAVLKAQEEERSRISLDMHDELGSGMTAIRLMSELAKTKMKEDSPAEIDRISESANDVLNKMNAIIWSMNSGNDTLGNLISYIRSYSMEYLENTNINCKVIIPPVIEEKEISGDKRRNVFLCVKETLNNSLKYSAASEIVVTIEANDHLTIRIHDNGKGIDMQKLREFGNGLKNIQKRMSSVGGSFSIENKNGTLTTLTLPL
jgi:signal transduction histidine kinase